MMFRTWMFILLLIPSAQAAESTFQFERPQTSIDSEDMWFGHNLSQTTAVLPQGHCSAGFQVVACGMTDHLSLGTSPFIWANYILPNVYVRMNPGGPRGDFALQIAQIGDGVDRNSYGAYQMSTTFGWASYRWVDDFNGSFYSNVIAGYYWNDTIPFSLRRPQPVMTQWQFSIMNLATTRITGPFFINTEFGILGLNEVYPHLHVGSSLGYRSGNFSFHFGFSITTTWSALWSETKADYWKMSRSAQASQKFNQDMYGGMYYGSSSLRDANLANDLGTHPEFSFQLLF